uniref:zinc ribbon domain-containing protein n=1 Tax=Collinsella bouchesdurhonensis TaxID=1907654 RepID=UPI00359CB060
MICPNCGHEPKKGTVFCTNCGAHLNEGAARPASDQDGTPASVGGPAAETPAPAREPIAETSPEAPAPAPSPVH